MRSASGFFEIVVGLVLLLSAEIWGSNDHMYIRRYAGLGRTGSVACTGPTCYTESPHDALATGFRNVYGIAGDKFGNIFASDLGNARIAKIWPNGSVESIVGTGVYSPFQYNDGIAGTATGLASVYGLSTDDGGNLYFSELNGNRIRVLYTNNTVYTVAGLLPGLAGDTSDGLSANGSAIGRPFGIHLWQNTFLYFVEFASCKVRYIDEYGLLQTVAGRGGCATNWDFTFGATIPTLTTLIRPRHVWADSAGAVYFTENRGLVRRVANGTMRIIAGNGNSVSYRYGIAGTSAAIGNIRGISGDSRGNIYVGGVVTDVYRIDTRTETVYKLAGASGSIGSVDCGVANSTRLGYVEGLYVDPASEDVYVADYLYSTIRVISSTGGCVPTLTPTLAPFINDTFSPTRGPTMGPSNTGAPSLVNVRQDGPDLIDEPAKYISTVVGINDGRSIYSCQGSGCYPSNHVATKNTLLYPYAVYVDVNGTIFVADTNNYRIVRVDANNTMTTIIGTGLTPATCCDGNHSLATNVGRVYGLSGSSDGVIYFAEYSEARIRAWYPNTSLVYTVAGVNPAFRFGFTPDGESIKGGRIAYPWGIFVEDESRTMYYTDNTFCLIRSFSLDTYIVSTIAGSGNCQSNQMYPWQVGRDYYASQVYTSAVYNVWANRNGEVFFSDSWNFVWRVYNGFARIFAGNGVYDTSAEYVQATSTTIASPRGITGDDFGNIYIVSSGENIVLKVTTNGTMYRIAGSSTWGYVDCTLATLGQMASPQGIAIDTSGNLYVADTSAHTIRRISETAYCSPTPTPTEAPSGPTMRPTIVKTAVPTVRPSWRPTTIKPSRRPTRMPTPRPTRIPTSQPSTSPTSWPSSRPSGQPSSRPSGQPSVHPSCQPSSQPSDVPSSQPSTEPTVRPTQQPSSIPSSHPTSQPSHQPSACPTSQPSSVPTDPPTSQPSSQPSRHPSSQPSHQPISSPSAQPTAHPSSYPTSQPSQAPSTHPTSQPSASPTTMPTSKPSTHPTRQPTNQPSRRPTSSPSNQPSTEPTGVPSGLPSSQPVSKPSSKPSSQPSRQPAAQPSSRPSSQPTSQPTLKTKAPTVRPTTAMPSRLPTMAPTFSVGIVGVYAVSAQLANDGLSCAVVLNVATNQAGKSGVFSCADVLVLSPAGTFTCTWTNTSALTIQLSGGSSSTFGIGSQVGLVSGLSSLRPLSLADGQTFSVAGRMVTVRSPVEPVRPSVVIKASTTISSCADWSVDLTRSTGNAGRTWTNTSVSVSLLPAAVDNSSAVLASRLLSSLSTSFPMAVPNAWLSSGVQYSVSIRLCNYLGGCGVGTAKVFVSNTSLSAPVVSILGNAAVSTYVNRSITVAASAYVPLCFGQQRTSGLSYTWSVWSGSSPVTVVNRAADPSTLMLAAYALSASSVYTVRVVVEDSRSQRSSQATMSLTTLSSALVARISPAVSSVLGVGQSVTLDASSSFDPDSSSATLSYTWTTTLVSSVTGVAVASDSPIALQVTNKSSSSIRSVALVTGVEYVANVTAIVRVTVSSGSKTGSASTAFRILSEPIPSVAISTTAAAVTNVDASRSVSLVGAVQAASTTTATWSVTGLSSSTLTAMVAGGTTSFAVTANRATSATLFLLPNALDAGAKYVFTLTCGKAAVSIAVSTNYPPYGGQLATNPSEGYSLQTSFALSTSDWVDSDLPLQYAFKFYSVATTSWLSIQSVSPASYCASVLPTGAEQAQYLVNVSVRAYDSYGAAAFSASVDTVTVKPIPAAQVAGVITSLLGNASSASAIQQVVSVGSAALNTVNCTGVSTSHCQTVLHRAACSSTSFTCGACLDGYVGITGDSNVPCYALTSVSGRRRRLTATHCTSNGDCSAWQTCVTATGLCTDRMQACPRDCSGHGTCQWRSTVTGAVGSSCSVVATNCEATCACSAGYGGLDCSHTSSDWQREQAVRATMMQSLETSVQQTNLDEASVASVALNVASLIASAASVSEANAATTVNVATALVGAAAASSASIPATSLTRLLTPLDHALRHVANRTVSEAAVNASVIVQTLEAYAATAAVAALPDADATTAVHSMYRLSTQAFALSTTGTLNSSLSVPTTALEAAQSVAQTNLRLQTNLSSGSEEASLLASANAIAVQLMEYPQRVLAASTAATVKSNLVSVATHALDATGDVLGEVSSFDIEIVHTTSIALSNVSAAAHYFDVNCTAAMVQNVTKVCPGSNHTLTFACNGHRSGVWRKHCPVLQPTCYGLTAQEAFAASSSSSSSASTDADRVSCVPKAVTSESTVCTCTIPESRRRRRRRRRRLTTTSIEQKADYLAVIVTYVASNFVDTFEETNAVGPDVLQKSYIVLALYGSLWVSCAIFMVVLYRKAQVDEAKKREAAIQRRHHSRVSPSVTAGSVSAAPGGAAMMPAARRRGGIGSAALMPTPGAMAAVSAPPAPAAPAAAVDATSVAAAGAAAAATGPPSTPLTKQVLRGKLLSYIESIIPKVFDDKPALLRLVQEMSRNHVYVKLVVEGLADRRSYVGVFKMMTTFTVLMFLLALMYDLQYPSDDGSCTAHATELTCLSRKSLLDNAQSYCRWDVSDGDCSFNANINVSFTDAAVCAVVTSWITSVLTRPLGYLFELLNAPSTEDLRNAAHASSAFEKLHASVMTGVRRASVAMHAILPTTRSDNAVAAARKSTLILHTTHIPEDTHEARKEIRVAMQELEQRQPGTSRLASTLHRSRMASSLSKMAAPSVDMNGSDAAELDTDVVLSPQMILHALRQQRTRLTGAKLDAFDRAWYFLLHYDQWRVEMDAERRAQWMARLISACADGGRRARVRREGLPTRVEDFVGQLLVDTVTSTVQETRIVDGLTDVEAGLHILQTFVRDILGQHTSVAKIFLAKAQAEFYRTNAVSRRVKALAIGVILAVNGFCLYFSIVRGYVKGLQWQAAYAMSCVIQLATEVLFFETLETMWVDFLLPNFAFAEMRRCHDILRAMVDSLSELMESEALQVRRGGHGSGSGEGSPSPVSSSSSSASSAPCVLNVPQHFYISNQLARRNPTLIESMMVLSYESYLPVGLDTGSDLTNGGADDVVGMHRRGLFCISWVSYFSATFLALVAAVPFEFHRLVIRFFSPFLVGGLVLAWAYISVNVLFLALFFGGVGAIALYVAYVVWKLHKQTRVVDGAPVEPLTTARESKPPLVVGAAASAASAADTRLMVVPVTSASSPAAAETMPALSPVYPRHVRSPPSSSPSRGTLSSTDAVKAAAARLVESPCEDGKDDSRPRDDHHYHLTRDTAKERRPSLHQQRSHRDASQNHSGSDSDDRSRSDSSDSDSSDGDGMSMASFLSFDLDARSRSVSLVEVASGSSKNVRRRNRSENGREGSLDTMPLPSESSQGGLRRRVSSTGSQQSTNATVTTNTSVPVRLVQPSVRHAHSSRPPVRSEPMFFADELPADDNGRQEETMVAAPARPRNASKTTPSPRVARPKK